MPYIRLVFLPLLVSASLASAHSAPITIGIDPTFPPFEYTDSNGQLAGFDVELGKAICHKIDRQCQFISLPFDSLIPALQARKFDMILSSLSINAERQKSIDFSIPLFTTPVYLVAAKSSHYLPNAASLKGKRVGVQQGSVFESYADKYWQPQGVTVVAYASPDQIYADLSAGRLDATLDDAVSANDAFLKKPQGADFALKGKEVKDQALFGQGTGIGFPKQGEEQLKKQVNQAITDIYQDGSFKRLNQQWFTFDVSVHPPSG